MDAEDRDAIRQLANGAAIASVREAAQPLGDALAPDLRPLSEADYESAHGEPLAKTLDLSTWLPGSDLAETYARLEREVAESVRKEAQYQQKIRETIFPALGSRPGAPPCAGVFRVNIGRLEEIHRKLLFNGGVEAC